LGVTGGFACAVKGLLVVQRLSEPAAPRWLRVEVELKAERQAVLDLRRALEERDDELAAAREINRRLMNQINRPGQ
jgi:hypothetical protein